MSTTPEDTPLPLLSAKTSLKRARLLFSQSTIPEEENDLIESNLIPPMHDPSIHKLSVIRKLRMRNFHFDETDSETLQILDKGAKSVSATATTKILKQLKDDALNLESHAKNNGTTRSASKNKKNKKQKTSSSTALITSQDADISNDSTMFSSLKDQDGIRTSDNKGTLIIHKKEKQRDSEKDNNSNNSIIQKPPNSKRILTGSTKDTKIPTPKWHAPWKLSSVLSSHLGWVRSISFDPTNDMFATGSADRTIKIFDLAKASVGAEDSLKYTLTGHIGPIRGLAFSPRHPYLFSAGEDKMIKCWDLETNQVVRHYHGHLSGVFCLELHPTLDLLVTGGRDAVARVWDMRTKNQIHCLGGHENTVGTILTKTTDPQIITGSYDSTIKLWDIVAGKTMSTLTHHKKAVRAICQPSFENTFLSASADSMRKWQARDGRFIKHFNPFSSSSSDENNSSSNKRSTVWNALTINDDGVVFGGGDDGSMRFWDYYSGYNFQSTSTIAQPGSLDAENGIYAAKFDLTGTRLITCEADKTIKIWKEDENATTETHPVEMAQWRKQCLKEAKQRY